VEQSEANQMQMSQLGADKLNQIAEDGYAIMPSCLDARTLCELSDLLEASHAGLRNLLDLPAIRELARSSSVRSLMEPVLGSNCFAVRGILFNKLAETNWKVAWHQDCVIAVTEQKEVHGWGPWSIKAGVHHVRPSSEVVSRMLAVRLHLDDCGSDNGPLRVLPGSHRRGFLSDRQIQEWPKDSAITCTVKRGDAILIQPLLLHASSTSRLPSGRRVVHVEFAAEELPNGLRWRDRV
jgi:ectoine hydroxylase-related dioxygenase (phytanoyl-CoA dioxygenase family)